jgi:hypothetical protein
MYKPDDIKIVWFGEQRPPDIDAAEKQIRLELYELMDNGMMDVSDLMFHTVFLGTDMEHDVVSVAPLAEQNTVECIYDAVAKWESIGETDLDLDIDQKEIQVLHDLLNRQKPPSTKH